MLNFMSSQSLSTIEAHSSMVAKGKKLKMLLQLQVRFSQNGRLADCLLSSCTTFSIFVIHTLFLYHWKGLFLLFPVIYISQYHQNAPYPSFCGSRSQISMSFPHIFEPLPTDLSHFTHFLAVSQTLKPIPEYIRHFPHI